MIFFFTATGNSKFIAERIGAATDDRLIDIAKCIQDDAFDFSVDDNESVGIIFPVYFFGLPMIVAEFLSKLKISMKQNTYTYAVMNCGDSTGKTEKYLSSFFHTNAVFGVSTVDNYVLLYKVKDEKIINEHLDKAEREVDEIIKHIMGKNNGVFNNYKGRFPNILSSLLYSIYKNGRKTKKFSVNERCTGCGICEKVCPRQMIKIDDGRPVWSLGRCELCLGCLHRCPEYSINYGKKTSGNGRYLNPRVHF